MTKMEFYNIEQCYSNNKPTGLRLLGRTENKEKVDIIINGDTPYFYILTEEKDKLGTMQCKTEDGFVSMYGDKLTKVFIDNPWDIRQLTPLFSKTFEGDIPYSTRMLIDNDIYTGVEIVDNKQIQPVEINCSPRTCMIDIETEYYGGSNSDMSRPIITIGFYDNYTDKIYVLSYKNDSTTHNKEWTYKSQVLKKIDGSYRDINVIDIAVKDEKTLLELFKKYVLEFDFDIFSGWNVNFDMIYILRRLELLNLNASILSPVSKYKWTSNKLNGSNKGPFIGNARVNTNKKYSGNDKSVMIRGRAIIDILKGYRRIKWKQVEGFRLDSVAKKEFGIGKIEYTGWMADFWKTDYDNFIKYNIRDIEMCLAIDTKYSVIDSLLNIRKISGCELSDVLYNSKIFDVYILRYCKGKFALPSKTYIHMNEDTHVEGGFVLEPVVGIHKNVIILDLKSLYPSIMLSFNMSPETVDSNGEISIGNGVKFRKQTGILKEILVDLLKKRDDLRALLKTPEVNKDPDKYTNIYKRQYYYKTFSNSAYGITLYPGFRLYNPAIGSSITFIGRFLADKIREFCESFGYIVIRQDTDSAFIDVKEQDLDKVIAKGKEIEGLINKEFIKWFEGMNNDISYFSIKFEKLYGIMFSGEEKKLYAGKIIWDWEKGKTENIEIKGFASVKSDRSQFSKNLQKHIFDMILNEQSNSEILSFIYQEIDKFLTMKYPFDYIGIPKAITKDLDEYENKNPWVKGVQFSMSNIVGFEFSPKPYLLYMKTTKKYNSEFICFNHTAEVPVDIKLDIKRMSEVSIIKIIEKQLKVLGIDNKAINRYIDNKITGQQTLF